jgi:hypothetical protein
VDLDVAGSSPVGHPKIGLKKSGFPVCNAFGVADGGQGLPYTTHYQLKIINYELKIRNKNEKI